MNSPVSAVLFDLGGVLVHWDGLAPLEELTQGTLSREEARRFWLESDWVRQFETGQCSAQAFADGVVTSLNLNLTPDQFLKQFKSWDRGPFPGASDLLRSLQPSFQLYCLSNNNPLHWESPELRPLLQHFAQVFVSFEIGLIKPDSAVFHYVKEQLPESPGQILFLDDNPECIEAAIQAGFQARQVAGVESARQAIKEVTGR